MRERICIAVIAAILLGGGQVSGAESAAGQLLSADGTLLARPKPGESWRAVRQKGAVSAGEML